MNLPAQLDASEVGQASRLSRTDADVRPSPNVPRPSSAPADSRVCPRSGTGGPPVLRFKAFDRTALVAFYGRHLPHWRQDGCTYFVTFRLGDSIPQSKLRQWETEMGRWLHTHPQPHSEPDRREFHEKFTKRFHKWLDAGYGACWLRRSEVSALVERALRHFDRERYALGHFVVMPNHVHALVTPCPSHDLSEVLQTWKSYTAHEANKLLNRTGKFWQDETFDHIVRNETQLHRFERYVLGNPAMAGLKLDTYRFGCGTGGVLGDVGQAFRLFRTDAEVRPSPNAPSLAGAPAGLRVCRPFGTGGTPVLPS